MPEGLVVEFTEINIELPNPLPQPLLGVTVKVPLAVGENEILFPDSGGVPVPLYVQL